MLGFISLVKILRSSSSSSKRFPPPFIISLLIIELFAEGYAALKFVGCPAPRRDYPIEAFYYLSLDSIPRDEFICYYWV
jgi:hypothetical protein